jgi:hypothetical protein
MAVPIALTGTTADVQVYTGATYLMGFSIKEDAGTGGVATARLRDGTTASGPVVVELELSPDQSATMWFGDSGIRINDGIFLDRIAGTTSGCVYVR